MSSSLAGVPISRRRRAASSAAVLGAVLLAVFVVAWARPAPGLIRIFAVLALVGAVMLGLMAWGLLRSVRLDEAEVTLNTAIAESVGAQCAGCECEHDVCELRVTDAGAPE
jgi:uncharacterized membrane protein